MELIRCNIYTCTMSAAACASRHLNAVAGGAYAVGKRKPGAGDPNCLACKDGEKRARALGETGIKAYKNELKGLREKAWGRTGQAAKQPASKIHKTEGHMDEMDWLDEGEEIETITAREGQDNVGVIPGGTPQQEHVTVGAGSKPAHSKPARTKPAHADPPPTKVCKRCGFEKPLSGFRENATCRMGVEPTCRICRNNMAKKAYQSRTKSDAKADRKKPASKDTPATVRPFHADCGGLEIEPQYGKIIADAGDFGRLGALLYARSKFEADRLAEIKTLCDRISVTIDTYQRLQEMFSAGETGEARHAI